MLIRFSNRPYPACALSALSLGRALRGITLVAALLLVGGCGGGGSSVDPAAAGAHDQTAQTREHAAAVDPAAADPNTPGAVGDFYVGHSSYAIESADTPISLAFLNDHKAGERGPVHIVGGKLYAGDQRLRLYGVAMFLGAVMPSKADAVNIASRLRKEGFNAVRFVSWDGLLAQANTWTVTSRPQGMLNTDQTLNRDALDHFDHFVYQLEQAGIYLVIPLHSGRHYLEAVDCVDTCEGLDVYLPSLIQSQKAFSAAFLNHVNPYTGKAYKDDAAVAALEVNNEDSLSHRWSKGTIDAYLTDPVRYPKYGAPLEALWRTWVQAKYVTIDAAAAAYGQALLSFDDLKAPLAKDKTTMVAPLYRDWLQFTGETDAAYYAGMVAYLKNDVGTKSLVMGTQSHYLQAYAREGDISSFNSYFGDVGTLTGELNPVNGAPVIEVQNKSVLSFADPKDTGLFGTHERKTPGKPAFLTEHASRVGNQHVAEAESFVSAYAGFQDLDAIFLTDGHSMNLNQRRDYFTGYYNVSAAAVSRVTAALSFRRGDMTPGQPFVLKKTKQSYLDAGTKWRQYNLLNFHFGGGIRAPLMMNMYQQTVDDPGEENVVTGGTAAATYTATTGEIYWKPQDRIVVDTPMTKTAIGLFSRTSADLGGGIRVDVGTTMNNYAVVQLTSLIKDAALPSSKMLLSLSGHFTVPGEYPRSPGQTTFSQGTAEPRIEAVPATVRIPTPKNLVVTALDRTGARKASVPVVRNGDYVEFVTGPLYDTGWYLVEESGVPTNNPPVVSLSAPSTVAFGSAAALDASAADSDGTIAKIEFLEGGRPIGSCAATPCHLDWRPPGSGTFALTARATDNLGASTTTVATVLTVVNAPPTAAVTAPATATLGVPVTLTASAGDIDGTVTLVEFFDNGALVGSDASAPYSVQWTPESTGLHSLTVRATDNLGATTFSASVGTQVSVPSADGLMAAYFDNISLSGAPVLTRYEAPLLTQTNPATPGPGLPADGWSVRWSGVLRFAEAGNYVLQVTSDDGARVWLDGRLVVDAWFNAGNVEYVLPPMTVSAGTALPITIEHYDGTGSSTFKLRWKTPSSPVYWKDVPISALASSVANSPPTAVVTAPATATTGVAVTLTAIASDSDGSVTLVEFFDNGALVGSDTSAPYSVQWTPASSGLHSLTARATDNLGATVLSAAVTTQVSAPSVEGLLASYFDNAALSGTPVLTRYEAPLLTQTNPATPGPGVPADYWSVRWTGTLAFSDAGSYVLQVTADDGVRVWFDGHLVVDAWFNAGNVEYLLPPMNVSAGTALPIRIEHYDGTGSSTVKLRWKTPSLPIYWKDVPISALSSPGP